MTNHAWIETEAAMDIEAARAECDRLSREHEELKSRLTELNSRVYLSPNEEVERKNLQKLKLAKKDRIALLRASSGIS